jgi:hypothetical protein
LLLTRDSECALEIVLRLSTVLFWCKQCDFTSYPCDFSLAPAFVLSTASVASLITRKASSY